MENQEIMENVVETVNEVVEESSKDIMTECGKAAGIIGLVGLFGVAAYLGYKKVVKPKIDARKLAKAKTAEPVEEEPVKESEEK